MPPLVIAHRTCPNHAPENSLAGIRAAATLGADIVEVDVRRSREGVPVLFHDQLLVRTAWPPLPVPVRWVPAVVLTRLGLRGGDGERVPTLSEALSALPDGLGVAIDTKDPGAAPVTLAAVHDAGLEDRALLWSEHEEAVRYYGRHAAPEQVALLRDSLDDVSLDRLVADANEFGAKAVSVPEVAATEAFIDRAAGRGVGVFAWFRTYAAQRQGMAPGLRGVVTDWVAEAVDAFSSPTADQ
ncbi:MAG: glycerophosphodiester phosphodiesterase [Acidimicrobiales bacterium]